MAPQRHRRRPVDPDVDQVAGQRGAEEVHGRVPSRASAQESTIGSARPFDENLLDATDTLCVALGGDTLHCGDEPLEALMLQVLRNLIGEVCSLGPGAWRIDEGESTVESDFVDEG